MGTRYTVTTGRVVKASGPDRTAAAILTYPVRDIDGDYLRPDGATWAGTLGVNWQHECPVGVGAVTLKAATVEGTPHTLPLGTTRFFESAADLRGVDRTRYELRANGTMGGRVGEWSERDCLETAEDTWRLVGDDIAKGVSVEFVPTAFRERPEVSELTGRKCMDVDAWALTGWAHCLVPRNPGALTLDPERRAKAVSLSQRGKLRSAVILKALTPYLTQTRSATVTGGYQRPEVRKAMDEDLDPTAGVGEPAVDPAADAVTADDTPPTAKAAYDAAQGCSDLAGMIRDAVGRSEHLKGKAKLLKLADDLEGIAADGQAVGDMVMSDVGGGDEDDDGGESDSDASDLEPAELTKSADGSLTFARSRYKAARVTRLGAADLREPQADAATLKALDRASRELRAKTKTLKQYTTPPRRG